jgi:hypothetical protein
MRIPNNLTDDFSMTLNSIHRNVNQLYLDGISTQVQMQKVNVMLGDASITQQDTFEPQKVTLFFEMHSRHLKTWSSQGIANTDTDDLRRLHVQFTTQVDKYHLSCYVAVQYHALPFYKCDDRIIKIKKQLIEIDEKVAQLRPTIEGKENLMLEQELTKRGKSGLNFEELLETMYNDEKLFSELVQKVDDLHKDYPEYYQAAERRGKLLVELNDMVVELYKLKYALIDQNKMMQGEEGLALHFDLEVVNKDERNGNISVDKIVPRNREEIIERFREIEKAFQDAV